MTDRDVLDNQLAKQRASRLAGTEAAWQTFWELAGEKAPPIEWRCTSKSLFDNWYADYRGVELCMSHSGNLVGLLWRSDKRYAFSYVKDLLDLAANVVDEEERQARLRVMYPPKKKRWYHRR